MYHFNISTQTIFLAAVISYINAGNVANSPPQRREQESRDKIAWFWVILFNIYEVHICNKIALGVIIEIKLLYQGLFMIYQSLSKRYFFSFLDRMVLFLPFFLSSMDFFFSWPRTFFRLWFSLKIFPEAKSSTCEFCRVRNVNKIWK